MPKTGSSIARLFVAVALALALGAGLSSPVLAQANTTAPAAQTSGTTVAATSDQPVETAQANPFADVPANSWAYDAVAKLAAAGYIQGYPDGQFKGQRPMTRYEMAVLVNRAVNGLEAKIAAGDKVNADAIAAVRRLVTEFQNELKNVSARVDDLTKKTEDLQKQADALAAAQKQFHFNANYFMRPGTYDQNSTVFNGPITLARTPATGVPAAGGSAIVLAPGVTAATPAGSLIVAPYAALPGGSGSTATNGNGLGPSAFGSAGSQNTVLVGPYTHGTDYVNLRMVLSGNIDPRFAYSIRFTTSTRAPNGIGVTSTSGGFCRGNAGNTSAGCAASDWPSNYTATFDYMWLGYFSPGGLYMKIGRWSNSESKYNPEALWYGGGGADGTQIGYVSPNGRFDGWVGYDAANVSAFNLQTANSLTGGTGIQTCTSVLAPGGGTVGNGSLNGFNLGCNNGAAISNAGIQSTAAYYFPDTRTNVYADYYGYYGSSVAYWAPGAGLCENAAGTSTSITLNTSVPCPAGQFYIATGAGPVTGSYITGQANVAMAGLGIDQFLGSFDHPQWRLWAAYGKRMGSDPFTGTSWVGNYEWYTGFAYSSMGHTVGGPIRPSTGVAGDNDVQLQVHYEGLNAPDYTGFPNGGSSLDQMYINNGANMLSTNLEFDHWFTKNIYIGAAWNHYNTLSGATSPVGGVTCPGCTLQYNANAFFLNSWSYF